MNISILDRIISILEQEVIAKNADRIRSIYFHSLDNPIEDATFAFNIRHELKPDPVRANGATYNLFHVINADDGENLCDIQITNIDGKCYTVPFAAETAWLTTHFTPKKVTITYCTIVKEDHYTNLLFKLIVTHMLSVASKEDGWYDLIFNLELTDEQAEKVHDLFPLGYKTDWAAYLKEYTVNITETYRRKGRVSAFTEEGAHLKASELNASGRLVADVESADEDIYIEEDN